MTTKHPAGTDAIGTLVIMFVLTIIVLLIMPPAPEQLDPCKFTDFDRMEMAMKGIPIPPECQ